MNCRSCPVTLQASLRAAALKVRHHDKYWDDTRMWSGLWRGSRTRHAPLTQVVTSVMLDRLQMQLEKSLDWPSL